MVMFMQRMSSPTPYTKDALQSLYGLFLSDLMAIFDTAPVHSIENQSGFKLFVEFNRLLLADFCEHHEVSYYAQRMGISSRYLSMIVKQVSHTTVAAYINQHLMLEACWLLKTSEHNIQEISDLLHFADQASFSKFFKRQKGLSPLQYRKMEHSSKMRAK
jgi:AraC-like DNA-binding protein